MAAEHALAVVSIGMCVRWAMFSNSVENADTCSTSDFERYEFRTYIPSHLSLVIRHVLFEKRRVVRFMIVRVCDMFNPHS